MRNLTSWWPKQIVTSNVYLLIYLIHSCSETVIASFGSSMIFVPKSASCSTPYWKENLVNVRHGFLVTLSACVQWASQIYLLPEHAILNGSWAVLRVNCREVHIYVESWIYTNKFILIITLFQERKYLLNVIFTALCRISCMWKTAVDFIPYFSFRISWIAS